MKKVCLLILLFVLGLAGCKKSKKPSSVDKAIAITITTPNNEPGYVYVDGRYMGVKTPDKVTVSPERHIVGVALQNSWIYLRKEIEVTDDGSINFTLADKPVAKTWKALWIGLYETKGNASTGDCSTHFSEAELDAGYEFFQWSLREHFEKYSYGTMKWEVERKDILAPVTLNKASSSWFTVEPGSITSVLPQIQPGVYDCVFVFWREREGACSFQSNYFGLAWTNPMHETIKTGFVTIKFDAGTSINDKINSYKANDPGVWVHEWLHTVGENFYQDKGMSLPQKAGGFSVHAAEVYQYTFPWMDWYKDFIAGRVYDVSGASGYLGIGPEALLKCTVSETALNSACR